MQITLKNQIDDIRKPVLPPLKWAGGKRWFAHRYRELLPEKFETYIEPFAGSAALFFSVRPDRAVLADLNGELINLYECIRDQPGKLMVRLKQHHVRHSPEYYYRMRSSRPTSKVGMAARMLYLNRTCWNGLYRVNKMGQFNVPIGTKTAVVLESDDFSGLSQALSGTRLIHSDFANVMDMAKEGDFVFVDPPYTVAHNTNGFVKYNEHLFSWADQLRLRKKVEELAGRGVKVLVTNAAHSSIYKLYEGYDQLIVDRAGVIGGAQASRGRFSEVVIRCY